MAGNTNGQTSELSLLIGRDTTGGGVSTGKAVTLVTMATEGGVTIMDTSADTSEDTQSEDGASNQLDGT